MVSDGDTALRTELKADIATVDSKVDSNSTAITDLDVKVDQVANSMSKYGESWIKGNFTKTLLAGGTAQTDWIGTGDITLSQSWKNFDAIAVFVTNDSATGNLGLFVYFTWQFQWIIDIAISSEKIGVYLNNGNSYWVLNSSDITDTSFPKKLRAQVSKLSTD